MGLFDEIVDVYPELKDRVDLFMNGTIILQDDEDGRGPYIHTWNYKEKPRPKLGPEPTPDNDPA